MFRKIWFIFRLHKIAIYQFALFKSHGFNNTTLSGGLLLLQVEAEHSARQILPGAHSILNRTSQHG